MVKRKAVILMLVLCISFAIIGVILLGVGLSKQNNYNNPDSESKFSVGDDYVNAYVGGDAYNYIINGTYFTAYAVMGIGFLIISTITGVTYVCLSVKSEVKIAESEKLPEL